MANLPKDSFNPYRYKVQNVSRTPDCKFCSLLVYFPTIVAVTCHLSDHSHLQTFSCSCSFSRNFRLGSITQLRLPATLVLVALYTHQSPFTHSCNFSFIMLFFRSLHPFFTRKFCVHHFVVHIFSCIWVHLFQLASYFQLISSLYFQASICLIIYYIYWMIDGRHGKLFLWFPYSTPAWKNLS